jgi:hypothetical protein
MRSVSSPYSGCVIAGNKDKKWKKQGGTRKLEPDSGIIRLAANVTDVLAGILP